MFFYIVLFFISYLLFCLYFGKIISSASIDYSYSIGIFMEKNKRWIGVPIVLIIVIIAGIILQLYLGYDLRNYIAEIVIAIVIAMIIGHRQILKWIENTKWVED